jgi:hypothetical protein
MPAAVPDRICTRTSRHAFPDLQPTSSNVVTPATAPNIPLHRLNYRRARAQRKERTHIFCWASFAVS